MHVEALDFVSRTLAASGGVGGLRVLEVGSLNVNGTPRGLCGDAACYVGIDRVPGRGVDVVCDAADYDGAGGYDLVICCEVLEHAPDPDVVIACARRALAPGGRIILTAAAPERPAHGCAGGAVGPDEHYAGITVRALLGLLAGWRLVHLEYHPARGDLYATAVRP
jgi:SAM-dependent methyltransferase